MGWMEDACRRFLAAYRDGLQLSCTVHCERKQQLIEKARKRREKIRSSLNRHRARGTR